MAFQTIMGTPAVAGQSQFLMKDGSLGLGTASPTARLDVNGSTRLRGLSTPGVVTTDGSGNLSSVSTASLGTSFVQNQTTSAQSGGFNVSGAGTVGGLLTAGAGATVTGTTSTTGLTVTDLSSGSVPFVGTSGAISQDNSNLIFDNTNKRLGIGVAAPTQRLDVGGYAKLNGPSALTGATVPAIATALFTGALPTAANSSTVVLLGGLTPARILSVSILAIPTAGSSPGFAFAPNQGSSIGISSYEYGYFIDPTGTLRLLVGSNGASLLGSPVRVFVTYMP